MQVNRNAVVLLAALCVSCGTSTSPQPDSVPDVARACARLSACVDCETETFDGRASGYDVCFSSLPFTDGLRSAGDAAIQCVLEAADCSEARACAFLESGSACPSSGEACDGTVLRSCIGETLVARDCGVEGLTCIDNGNLECGRETSCTASRCDGDRLFVCTENAAEIAIDCGPGLCHVDAESGHGWCLPSAETCKPGPGYCDGDVAVNCNEGSLVRSLCLPGQCRDTDEAFCYVEDTCASSCEGDALLACVGNGRKEALECTQWGYSGCAEDGTGARCVP